MNLKQGGPLTDTNYHYKYAISKNIKYSGV